MTECLNPMAPNDEELLRYALDGEALSEQAKEHLDSCPICRQRMALYTEANVFLTTQLYRSQCPSPAKLTDCCAPVALNLLSNDERMSIAEHVNVCPLCSADIASIRRDLNSTDLLPEPEASGLATIISFSPNATVRRLVATLQTQRPQLVTRSSESPNSANGGTASEAGWPKHYKADTLDISLHLSRSSNGEMMLLGLFTSTDPQQNTEAFEGCAVDLYTSSTEKQAMQNGYAPTLLLTTQVDDLGNIVFKAVPIGTYSLLVHLPAIEITIEGINVE
jgi:hypothetical protein